GRFPTFASVSLFARVTRPGCNACTLAATYRARLPNSLPCLLLCVARVGPQIPLSRFGRCDTLEVTGHEKRNGTPWASSPLGPRTPSCESPYVYRSSCGQSLPAPGWSVAMPGTAKAPDLLYPRLYYPPATPRSLTMVANGQALAAADRGFLVQVQRQGLDY